MQDLERDDAFVLGILCEVDRSHPTAAKLPIYCVSRSEDVADALDWGCHAALGGGVGNVEGRRTGVQNARARRSVVLENYTLLVAIRY